MQVMYHSVFILFSLLAPGRAYHAISLNDCTLHGGFAIWRPAGLTMQFMYYLDFSFPYLRLAGLTMQCFAYSTL